MKVNRKGNHGAKRLGGCKGAIYGNTFTVGGEVKSPYSRVRMSSAVHKLQKAIVDGNLAVTQLLRQTKLIAAKLNLEDVEKRVDLELNG